MGIRVWTTPRTWADGDHPTAGLLNSHIRDNLSYLYERLADNLLGADDVFPTMTVESGYRSLVIVASLRTALAGTGSEQALVRFNNDSGSNYDYQYNSAIDTGLSSGEALATTGLFLGNFPRTGDDANSFGPAWMIVPNYSLAGRVKHCQSLSGNLRTSGGLGTAQVIETAGVWRTTDAITSIKVVTSSGGDFKSGSRVTVYGDLF